MNILRHKWILIIIAASTFAATSVAAKSEGTLGSISDSLAIGVPTLAFAVSLYNEDIEDTSQFVLSLAGQELFVEGAKDIMSETYLGERPSDKGKDSSNGFISSHVSATTAGAIKLWQMYPDNNLVKSFSILSVGTVFYQRIEGDHHTPLQAGLGVGTAFLFDWIGNGISDWLRGQTVTNSNISQQQAENLFLSMRTVSGGSGLMAIFTYIY